MARGAYTRFIVALRRRIYDFMILYDHKNKKEQKEVKKGIFYVNNLWWNKYR